jgi:hypothetical protein
MFSQFVESGARRSTQIGRLRESRVVGERLLDLVFPENPNEKCGSIENRARLNADGDPGQSPLRGDEG